MRPNNTYRAWSMPLLRIPMRCSGCTSMALILDRGSERHQCGPVCAYHTKRTAGQYASTFQPLRLSGLIQEIARHDDSTATNHGNTPGCATPILGRQLRSRSIAPVPRTEALPVLRDVLLDRHLGVTEPHQTHLAAFLCQHGRFLGRTWSGFGLVVAGEFLASVGDHLTLGSAYQPAGILTVAGPDRLPSRSKAYTRARTGSARRIGSPEGTRTTFVRQPRQISNTISQISLKRFGCIAVFNRWRRRLPEPVQERLGQLVDPVHSGSVASSRFLRIRRIACSVLQSSSLNMTPLLTAS